jgi:hypothetical protein
MPDPTRDVTERVTSANGAQAATLGALASVGVVADIATPNPDSPQSQGHGSTSRTLGGPFTPASGADVDRISLRAEIAALEACATERNPKRVKGEIDAYLKGAHALLDTSHELQNADWSERTRAARILHRKAMALYYGYVQKTNRLWYVGGVLGSALVIAGVLPFLLYGMAHVIARVIELVQPGGASVFRAADLPALLVLFGFAGLGSAVSVLSRLDKVVVPPVFTKQLIFVSGAGRPVVAAVFATVVYAAVKGKIVPLEPVRGGEIYPGMVVYWWCIVVAFLCGYSERFASDLLGKTPFASTAAPAEAGVEKVATAVPTDRQG